MSCHFSQAQAAGSMPQSSLDTELSATSNQTTTASASSGSESETASSRTPQSSLMCERSTERPTVGEWISSLPAFPVSGSRSPESEKTRAPSGTFGPIRSASSASVGPALRSSRTRQLSLLTVTSEPFLRTWKRLVTSSRGRQRLSALMTWELGTRENGRGLSLPILTAAGYGANLGGGSGRVGKIRMSLETMARKGILPTLTVSGNYNRKGASKTSGDGLATALRKWPTLCARDAKGVPGVNFQAATLPREVGGPLNPEWCEWFMGWPIGATGLEPLAMPKFQSWLRQHSGF